MYYLFIRSEKNLEKYKKDFDRVKANMELGKTPVYNEMRSAKTNLVECFPYQFISGVMIICGTFLISKIECDELIKIAVVMLVNSFCYSIANFIFTVVKHQLRIKLCYRLKIEPSECNIAVMESLEYQSV